MILLSIAFFLMTPFLIYYATGYRLTDSFNWNPTGGLYILTSQSGVKVYVNEEEVKESNLFQRNIFVQHLKPGTFRIRTSKEGYTPWEKELSVYPERVTETYPFMLPEELEWREVFAYIDKEGQATSTSLALDKTKHEPNPDLNKIIDLFAPVSATSTKNTKTATSTLLVKTDNKIALTKIDGRVVATWTGKEDERPPYFCEEIACRGEIWLETVSNVDNFDFFPGRNELVLVAVETGIQVIEIDNRSKQNSVLIREGKKLDFRLSGNTIYVKDGKKYFSLEL